MNVGKILTVGQVLDSTERDWESWCTDLLDFSFEEGERRDAEKVNGYCYAWKDCFSFLKQNMPNTPEVRTLPLLFEYMPPLRNGRRSDVIILMDNKVVVLEFKATAHYNENEMIQANGYVHYIETSHEVSLINHMEVEGYLVRTKDHGENHNCEIGTVLDSLNFTNTITASVSGHAPYPNVDEWTDSETTTIPSIMEAVRLVYENGANQGVRYLQDGDLGASLPFINDTIASVQQAGGKAVIIVDGVPGSGKTYLGTQVAFDRIDADPPAVYTSGNDPLINNHHMEDLDSWNRKLAQRLPPCLQNNKSSRACQGRRCEPPFILTLDVPRSSRLIRHTVGKIDGQLYVNSTPILPVHFFAISIIVYSAAPSGRWAPQNTL